MVEQTVKTPSNTAPGGGANTNSSNGNRPTQPSTTQPKPPAQQAQDIAGQAMAAGRDIAGQAKDVGRDIKDKVSEFAETSAETVKARASEFAGAAKDFAAQAGETLKDRANDQKNAGAEYVGTIAEAIRRAAREFDGDLPIAAVYMRKAASRVEDISDTVQHGDIQDLMRGVQSFARRQPTAFLGLAVLAGFGVVRFLKSSGGAIDQSPQPSQGGSGNAPRRANYSAENRGYRDEFTR
jgi:gas vesicle protein